jgi:beta-phosphoglucomutase-like phosphatase (HAD superfamily)
MTGTTLRTPGAVVEPLPGVETTFAALRAVGIHVCLVTDMPRAAMDRVVDVLGWRDAVDLVLAADPDDALRGPPFPDLVLAAALRTRVDDVREVAVASVNVDELIAGARAGASVVANVVSGPDADSFPRDVPVTHVLHGVHELPDAIASAMARYSSGGGGR